MKKQQKWTSIEEMYADLKKSGYFDIENNTRARIDIPKIIEKIETADSSQDFYNCTCLLSSLFESMDKTVFEETYADSNIYVLTLNAVFRNKAFISTVGEVSSKNIDDLKKNSNDLAKLIFINTAISLGFFGIALNFQSISNLSIEFLRKNLADLVKNIQRTLLPQKLDLIKICYFLEKVAWDNRLHYNENFVSTFPIKLDSNFLFINLKTARSIAGIALTSLLIRPTIENRFKKIVINMDTEKFSISFALHSIYELSNNLDEKIKHYYRHAPKDVSNFFDVFIKDNEKNLIFCFKRFCSGFHFQEEKKFFEIILEKIKEATDLKNEFIEYSKAHFRVFSVSAGNQDDAWTNKVFLISIKTLSVLEQVCEAKDTKWTVDVAIYELCKWVLEVHEVLNKYYIEDDWDKIKNSLVKENEENEWKSSFFMPIELDVTTGGAELAETIASKKIFEKILKVVIGMLNTNGGSLLVGVVENPEAVKRTEIFDYCVKKNGVTFFDINYEFKKYGKTLDQVRLQILDNLKQITDCSTDQFNGLIEFDPIFLRDEARVVTIIRISIKKSNKFFYNVKKENNSVWISLTKRASGQNTDVDIREYI